MVRTAQTNSKLLTLEICGQDRCVPLLDGTLVRYVNLDNAASTPAFRYVNAKVQEFLEWYSSVHRGSGFKSLLSTHVVEDSRRRVADFVGADLNQDVVIFVKNTTEAINKLANRLDYGSDGVVLTTVMEHHSNDLPWRAKATVDHVEVLEGGALDIEDLERKIDHYRGRLRLVAVTGASNVTGIMPPIHAIAERAHAAGALVFVDAAQLAPHRAIDMHPSDPAQHIDFLALSGHKMYAPFGTGALIGPKDVFARGAPDYSGGGTIEVVTLDEVHWAPPPERDEAGSPNVVGIMALAASTHVLEGVGMESIAEYERDLTGYALRRLKELDGIQVFGPSEPEDVNDRLGVIAFQVIGIPHAKVAAMLSFEAGIGVRNGCFCAHPYVLRLLGVPPEDVNRYKQAILAGDRSEMPGMVRASFGAYNTRDDVDTLIQSLHYIIREESTIEYDLNRGSGEYWPRDLLPNPFAQFFEF